MNPEDLDREIGRLFEAQRAADEAAAPDLHALLGRPAARRASRSAGHVLAMVAAVAIVIVAGARLLRSVATAPRDRFSGVTTLAEWRSPTDFLLRTPGSDIWTRVPSLGSTGPAADTQPNPSPTKGVAR
jgi:hypothetical protein